MSHPEELRNLVINEVENGSSISAALEKYNVSRSSYQRWINLKKETGTAAIPPRNTQPYKVDNVQLRNYIEENPRGCLQLRLNDLNNRSKLAKVLFRHKQ